MLWWPSGLRQRTANALGVNPSGVQIPPTAFIFITMVLYHKFCCKIQCLYVQLLNLVTLTYQVVSTKFVVSEARKKSSMAAYLLVGVFSEELQ